MKFRPVHPHTQRGAVLVVSMILLLVLTLLAISSMNSTVMQERMAANSHEHGLAFAATEAALSEGEAWLGNPALAARPEPGTSCTGAAPRCQVWAAGTPWKAALSGADRYQEDAWWQANAIAFGEGNENRAVPLVAAQPHYVIEEIGRRNPTGSRTMDPGNTYQYYYAVTARGIGRSEIAAVILQTTFTRMF